MDARYREIRREKGREKVPKSVGNLVQYNCRREGFMIGDVAAIISALKVTLVANSS